MVEAGLQTSQRTQVVTMVEKVCSTAQGTKTRSNGGPREAVLLLHETADEEYAVDAPGALSECAREEHRLLCHHLQERARKILLRTDSHAVNGRASTTCASTASTRIPHSWVLIDDGPQSPEVGR